MTAAAGEQGGEQGQGAAWGEAAPRQRRWPASLAFMAAVALYVALPAELKPGLRPAWLVPAALLAAGALLTVVVPYHAHDEPRRPRSRSG